MIFGYALTQPQIQALGRLTGGHACCAFLFPGSALVLMPGDGVTAPVRPGPVRRLRAALA
jgi:hypothetical protein